MKKQLFSFIAMLAILVLAGSGAWAADEGLTFDTPLEIVKGSTVSFSVADANTSGGGTATGYEWTVLAGSTDDTNGDNQAGADASNAYSFVTSLTDATTTTPTSTTAYVKFLEAPSDITTGTYDIFIVQVTASSTNGCTTVRRYYISVFDFTVEVYLSDASGNSVEDSDNPTEHPECSSWSGSVVHNGSEDYPFEGDSITDPHADYYDNSVSKKTKTSREYFTVKISLDGNTSMDLDDIKWRLCYSLTTSYANAADADVDSDLSLDSIYYVTSSSTTAGAPTFTSESGDEYTAAAVNAALEISSANDSIFFPVAGGTTGSTDVTTTEVSYTFAVATHNLLSANDMTWGIRLEEVDLETSTSTDYNNGSKVNTTTAGTTDVTLDAATENSDTYTIRQTPATSVIDVAD